MGIRNKNGISGRIDFLNIKLDPIKSDELFKFYNHLKYKTAI